MLLPLLAAAAAVSGSAAAEAASGGYAARLLQSPGQFAACASCAASPSYYCGGASQTCVATLAACPNPSCTAGAPSQCSTAGAPACGATSASLYTSCYSCASASHHWCGGAAQQCVSSPLNCPDAVCAASFVSECATAGNASCSADDPRGPASFTTCASCAGSPFFWCGGAAQRCSLSPHRCASHGCSASSPPQCSSSGAPSCASPASSKSAALTTYYASLAGDADGPAKAVVTQGVAASVLAALLQAPLPLCWSCERTDLAPHLAAWTQPAQRAHRLLTAAFFFYTLGMYTAFAAPALPWLYLGGAYLTGLVIPVAGYSGGGALCMYVGLYLVLQAWAMMLTVAIRLRAFAQTGAFPPPAKCAANLVAAEGSAWAGLALVLVGAAASLLAFYLLAGLLPPGTATPGASLLCFAVPCLLAGTILLSCAAGHVRGMPGVGRSRTHCCCPEAHREAQAGALHFNSPKVAPHA
jgi:hypothetical protein